MSFLVKERTQLTRLRDRTDFSAHLIIWALAAAHLILAIATPPKANSPALGDSHQSPSATSSSGADIEFVLVVHTSPCGITKL